MKYSLLVFWLVAYTLLRYFRQEREESVSWVPSYPLPILPSAQTHSWGKALILCGGKKLIDVSVGGTSTSTVFLFQREVIKLYMPIVRVPFCFLLCPRSLFIQQRACL